MNMDFVSLGAYLFGIVLVYVLVRALFLPLKMLMRVALSAALGGIALAAVNLAGRHFGIHVALNLFTATVTGFLGVPGVLLLVAAQALLAA